MGKEKKDKKKDRKSAAVDMTDLDVPEEAPAAAAAPPPEPVEADAAVDAASESAESAEAAEAAAAAAAAAADDDAAAAVAEADDHDDDDDDDEAAAAGAASEAAADDAADGGDAAGAASVARGEAAEDAAADDAAGAGADDDAEAVAAVEAAGVEDSDAAAGGEEAAAAAAAAAADGSEPGAEEGAAEEEGELAYPAEYYDADGTFVGNPDTLAWGTTLYDYTAQSDAELSFAAGELIGILEHDNDGWMRGDYYGYQGSFPTTYVQVYDDDQSDEVQQRKRTATQRTLIRREERDKLKDEMRGVMSELEVAEARAAELEEQIQAASARRQALQKELRKQRANSSDKQSVGLDLLKLVYDLDVVRDSIINTQTQRKKGMDALATFGTDVAKEAKTSPGLAPFAGNLAKKLADLRTANAASDKAFQDLRTTTVPLRRDVDGLVRAVATD